MRPILLLFAVSLTGVNSEQRHALFEAVPAAPGDCPAVTMALAQASKIECAAIVARSDTWVSFSFIGGVCVLSNVSDCASSGAAVVFRMRASATPAAAIGYETVVSGQRFWVFQQRQLGTVNFSKNWTDYECGFGDSTDFWSGLLVLNNLTKYGNSTLRMEAVTMNYTYYVAEWSKFAVGNLSTNFTMSYEIYLTGSSNVSGSDFMIDNNGRQFSTMDRDNDIHPDHLSMNFAGSGFWYGSVVAFNPNGLLASADMAGNPQYISCYNIFYPVWPNIFATLRFLRMMLRL